MPRAGRYSYYDPPRNSGVLPSQLRQLLRSECLLVKSLRSFERWRVELYGIREHWIVRTDGLPRTITYEEICEEEAECDFVHAYRARSLERVRAALSSRARPRGA